MNFEKEGTPYEKLKIGMAGIDLGLVEDIEFDGVDFGDSHDFCDAYISYASYEGRDLTEEELEWISENHTDWVYDKLMDHIY